MAEWPDIIKPSYPLEEEDYKPTVRSEFENGSAQTRARGTRARGRWRLRWVAMPEADYQLLKAFFRANAGGQFTWTHPISGTEYTVRFGEDILPGTAPLHLKRQVELTLEEV